MEHHALDLVVRRELLQHTARTVVRREARHDRVVTAQSEACVAVPIFEPADRGLWRGVADERDHGHGGLRTKEVVRLLLAHADVALRHRSPCPGREARAGERQPHDTTLVAGVTRAYGVGDLAGNGGAEVGSGCRTVAHLVVEPLRAVVDAYGSLRDEH